MRNPANSRNSFRAISTCFAIMLVELSTLSMPMMSVAADRPMCDANSIHRLRAQDGGFQEGPPISDPAAAKKAMEVSKSLAEAFEACSAAGMEGRGGFEQDDAMTDLVFSADYDISAAHYAKGIQAKAECLPLKSAIRKYQIALSKGLSGTESFLGSGARISMNRARSRYNEVCRKRH